MADIASSKSKMNDTEINADAPLSEALHEKIGANINYLIDTTDNQETRLDDLETGVVSKTTATPGSTTSTSDTTIVSVSLTPTTPNVLIVLDFANAGISSTNAGTLKIKRGATTLAILSPNISNASYTYVDTGATEDASNTYNITGALNVTGTITWFGFSVSAISIK